LTWLPILSDPLIRESYQPARHLILLVCLLDSKRYPQIRRGYAAHDEHFYFAAKIADDTPQEGSQRFATRDPDADFHPEVSYELVDERGRQDEFGRHAKLREHCWSTYKNQFPDQSRYPWSRHGASARALRCRGPQSELPS